MDEGYEAARNVGLQLLSVTSAIIGPQAADVKSKIADLKKMERVLRGMAAKCDGAEVPECPIIDALFEPKQVSTL